MDLVTIFGMALAQLSGSCSKLLPSVPLLRLDDPEIPTELLKEQFIRSAKEKSYQEMLEEISEVKESYGMGAHVVKDFGWYVESFVDRIPEKPSSKEKRRLRQLREKIDEKLK